MGEWVKKDYYETITAEIVAALEKSQAEGKNPPWVRPWKSAGAFRNAFTGRPYSGLNTIILSMKRFTDPRYATYKAIKAHGGQVRYGEKGTQVIFWKFLKKEEKGVEKTVPMLRVFTVFNVEQADGLKLKPLDVAENSEARRPDIEEILKDTGAEFKTGTAAYYSPSDDSITLPAFESFASSGDYYATAFHELGHWTGTKSRLDRDLTGRFGGDAYAFEELVAELTSSFSCRNLGVDSKFDQNNVRYIKHWIARLKSDNKAIFRAASLAEAATKFIHKVEEVVEETEEEAA